MQSTNDLETLVNSTQPLLDMVANHGNGWQRPIATIVSLTFPAAENVKVSRSCNFSNSKRFIQADRLFSFFLAQQDDESSTW